MYDRFNRRINYLRVSVTDRCNLRCVYCMPADGVQLMEHNEILRFDEIVEVVQEAVRMGVDKVRITGGEPLVRRGIIDLIKQIGQIEGIKDFAMTTNGIYLPKYAHQLVDAGLQRVNVSLDTLNPEKYKQVTRVGRLVDVIKGIDAAKEAGLNPIKINCVIQESSEEPDAKEVAAFCEQNGLKIRYIREMDLEKGQFWKVNGGEGGACNICNRLRLTSDGKIKPCLFSDIEYDVREYGVKEALDKALGNKPKSGTSSFKNKFSKVGG
jgi:cyclic pyranopterin phosphate synthase